MLFSLVFLFGLLFSLSSVACGGAGNGGLVWNPQTQSFFWVYSNDPNIYQYSPASNQTTVFSSGFTSPGAIALDPQGNLYVANTQSQIVSKVDPTGFASPFVVGTANFQPQSVAVSPLNSQNDFIVVVYWGNSNWTAYDGNSARYLYSANLYTNGQNFGVTFNPSNPNDPWVISNSGSSYIYSLKTQANLCYISGGYYNALLSDGYGLFLSLGYNTLDTFGISKTGASCQATGNSVGPNINGLDLAYDGSHNVWFLSANPSSTKNPPRPVYTFPSPIPVAPINQLVTGTLVPTETAFQGSAYVSQGYSVNVKVSSSQSTSPIGVFVAFWTPGNPLPDPYSGTFSGAQIGSAAVQAYANAYSIPIIYLWGVSSIPFQLEWSTV